MNNEIYFTCDKCNQSFYEIATKENLTCPFCGADDTHLYGSISVEQYEQMKEMEDKDFICDNCLSHFTGKQLFENASKCPNCNKAQNIFDLNSTDEYEEETELDYEIPDEDWEDI